MMRVFLWLLLVLPLYVLVSPYRAHAVQTLAGRAGACPSTALQIHALRQTNHPTH